MRSKDWNNILTGLLLAPIPLVVRAEIYLTENQASAVLFPAVKMKSQTILLTPQEAKRITQASGERVLDPKVRVLRGPHRETLFIDQVVGKHEFITYAVAIGADEKVTGIEIMDYRETYGYQVREADWRKQFVGKNNRDPLK